MALYLNNFDLEVPVQRLEDGHYMFGTKKIYAKIMNDKLVVRVGGGYMLIEEFLNTYGQQEFDKVQQVNSGARRSMATAGSPARKSVSGVGSKAGRTSPGAMKQARSPTGAKKIGF